MKYCKYCGKKIKKDEICDCIAKKKKLKKIVLILLIIIIIVTGLSLCIKVFTSNSNSSKKEKNNQDKVETKKEETKKVDLSLNDELVKDYYRIFADDTGEFYSSYISKKSTTNEELNDEEKFKIAARSYTKDELTRYDYKGNKTTKSSNVYKFTISKETFEKRLNELFNTKEHNLLKKEIFLAVQKESPIQGMATSGVYNAKTNNFEFTTIGIGGSCGFDNCTIRYAKLIESYKEGDYLYLKEKQIYVYQRWDYFEFGYNTIYKDYNQKQIIKDNIKTKQIEPNDYLNEGQTVTIVLKKGQNENYYFVKSIVE